MIGLWLCRSCSSRRAALWWGSAHVACRTTLPQVINGSPAAPPQPPAQLVKPRRTRSRDEHNDSDSDEELLSEKISRVVHRNSFLRSVLGKLVSKPRRPTLDATHLRQRSQDGGMLSAARLAQEAEKRSGRARGGTAGSAIGAAGAIPRSSPRLRVASTASDAGVNAPAVQMASRSPLANGARATGAGPPSDCAAGGATPAPIESLAELDAAVEGAAGAIAARSAAAAAASTAEVSPDAAGSGVDGTDDTGAAPESADGLAALPRGARIIYRRTGAVSAWMKSRDYCVLQDFFEMQSGTKVVYEMSVQHR